MRNLGQALVKLFVSLRLTVVLLALGIVLVFVATLAQTQLGVWGVQQQYFHTFFAFPVFRNLPLIGTLRFIMPGGYLVGGLLLLNLVAAHIYRFHFTWKKFGIWLAHFGVILLLIGELLSGLWQEDYAMRIAEGQTKTYSEHYHDKELAIVDTTNPDYDEVVAIPEAFLAQREPLQHAKLPFRIVVHDYFPNSGLGMRDPKSTTPAQATAGLGLSVVAMPEPVVYSDKIPNAPAATIELVTASGSIGTWLVSTGFSPESAAPILRTPQTFNYDGHTYSIALRPARTYRPFSLTLLKFSHDVYAGTDIPKNFSSKLRLTSPGGRDDRDVLIYMNNPLRYAGLTFYQASYEGEHTTVLQVVRNPSWTLPYISCSLVSLGLLVQFGISLVGFMARRSATVTPVQP